MHSLDGIPDFPLRLEAEDGAARAGVLETPRGHVRTPCFMPVGTKGTVKAMSPERLQAVGAQIILANTYHLALRPGSEVVRTLGGLHRFMAWDGPILTDSGGYQVFSLRDTARVDDSGAEFLSVYDGSRQVFTPERAMGEQQTLGADMIMCLDQCPPGGSEQKRVAEAVERTTVWARRCKAAHQKCEGLGTDGPQMLLGISQGGVIAGAQQAERGTAHGDRVSWIRHRGSVGGRRPGGDAGGDRTCHESAAKDTAAVLHGHRRPRRACGGRSLEASTSSTACFRRARRAWARPSPAKGG